MNQKILKYDLTLQNVQSLKIQSALNYQKVPKEDRRLNQDFANFSGRVLELIKSNTHPEIFIRKFVNEIKQFLKVDGYFITSKINNENFIELEENFNYEIRIYLFDGGLIQLSLNEKKSLIVDYPEQTNDNSSKNLLIIPFVYSENIFIIFCLIILDVKSNFINPFFPLIEMQFNLAGSYLINKFFDSINKELKSNLFRVEHSINQDLSYATVGKICLKSFHNLKNRTQVIISSLNLLTKLLDIKNDKRIEKIFEILGKEIPEFSRIIKLISEHSKLLVTEAKPIYFEFDQFIYDMQNIFDAVGISSNFKFNFLTKISKSKIFGYNHKLLQAFILFFLEIHSNGINEINIDNEEDEKRLRFKIQLNQNIENDSQLQILFDEKSNLKFACIKDLFKQNSCIVITNSSADYFEVVISIPKRSSQFKSESLHYVEDFNSRG